MFVVSYHIDIKTETKYLELLLKPTNIYQYG